jgi:hypothetical protein
MGLDQMDGVAVGPDHEAGWLTKGIFRRRHQVHCNTCGATGEFDKDFHLVKAVAATHSHFPDVPLDQVMRDARTIRALDAEIDKQPKEGS